MASKQLSKQGNFLANRMRTASEDISQNLTEQDKTIENMERYMSAFDRPRTEVSIKDLVPAPAEWNKFPRLPEDKMIQLKMSIMNAGVLTPIIVWERPEGNYMILSGHNRVKACEEILEEYSDVRSMRRDYSKIPAIIIGKDELDESLALQIILDTNVIQRNDLPTDMRISALRQRISILQTQTDEHGRKTKDLMEESGTSQTTAYEDVQIGTKLIPVFLDMYFARKINRRSALKLTMYDEGIQKWIYDEYRNRLTNELLSQLGKRIKTKEQIREIFDNPDSYVKKVKTQITVPQDKLQAVRNMCNVYAFDPEFAELVDKYMAEHYNEEE